MDDEPLARRRIRSLLSTEPDIEVVGESGDGTSAVKSILEHKPDLLFLDVQMPELDGFGVLEKVCTVHLPMVVFVTAYDRYAVKAFESHALDYLLKPFKRERFADAVARVRDYLRQNDTTDYEERLAQMFRQLKESKQRLVIRAGGRLIFLRYEDIDWIEAAANYARIHAGRELYTIREKISTLEEKLDPQNFVRIHRSIIVNADKIREVQSCGPGEYVVILRDGKELPLGRSFREHMTRYVESARAVGRDERTKSEPA